MLLLVGIVSALVGFLIGLNVNNILDSVIDKFLAS